MAKPPLTRLPTFLSKEIQLAESKYRFPQRLDAFIKTLQNRETWSPKLIFYGSGWVVSLVFVALSFRGLFIPAPPAALVNLFFLLKFSGEIDRRINPLPEALLILFFLFYLLEKILLSVTLPSPDFSGPGIFAHLSQFMLLGALLLIFSTLLYQNSKWKNSVIILFAVLGYGFYFYWNGSEDVWLWIFQILLLFLLLRRTAWLEELTFVESWIYLVAVFLLLDVSSGLNPLRQPGTTPGESEWMWSSAPQFLFLLFKWYLIALLIKIPVMLVYNHASLSGKLQISSLFQSTFPQLVQFFALVLIFYFFLSAWQAQNLSSVLLEKLQWLEKSENAQKLNYHRFSVIGEPVAIAPPGYAPLRNWRSLPARCIIGVPREETGGQGDAAEADNFLFSRRASGDSSYIHLVPVDSLFMKEILADLRVLAGNALSAHSFEPERWASFAYRLNFWEQDRDVRIFPFAILPKQSSATLVVAMEATAGADSDRVTIRVGDQEITGFTLGRVFLPFRGVGADSDSFFAFDVVLDVTSWKLWSGLGPILLFMALVYLLLNAIVIRRMVKFGSRINKIIVQKFKQLKQGIQEISGGNLDYQIKFEGEDEFVELADHFNEMGVRLKQTISEAREKERLQFELQNARQVQLSLLPRELPEIPGYRIAASLQTATEVGGDFYDAFPLPAGDSGEPKRFLLTIGDVSGKGSSAAFYMAQCMSLIRFSRQFTADPAEICTRLNEYFTAAMVDRQIFVTAIVGVLDIERHEFTFVRAGHTHPLFIPEDSAQKIRYLETKGIGIGLTARQQIFEQNLKPLRINFEPGDTLALYTDGMVEASRPLATPADGASENRELYDEARLEQKLDQLRTRPAEEIKTLLENDLQSFYAGHPQVDDHTVMIVQRLREASVELIPDTG